MAWRLPEVGGVFVQAESEVASINMVFGAGACGVRSMTSSSSPGVSLMQEGISFIACAETPVVIVNMMRGGPGLGNISPSQADYFQAVKRGGHGDYRVIVIAPSTVQELADSTVEAFDLSMKYRMPVMLLGDGILGQMSEPVVLPDMREVKDETDWAVGLGGDQKIVKSLHLIPENSLEMMNLHLQRKYKKVQEEYIRFEEYLIDDAEYIMFSYGTTARVCRSAVDMLRAEGIKIGLFRPISLWPFPSERISKIISGKKKAFVAEMAFAQFEEDIRLAVNGKTDVKGFYKLGGAMFEDSEICSMIKENLG
jgi:2-oxoglutarate ferredoxin oxidoreductase subunit alpha